MQPAELPFPLPELALPNECGLLDWLRSRVSRRMLEELALNDYGEESAEHLAAIEAQLGPQPQLGPLPWHPLEVLELERWATPDSERDHIKRLLACAILLRVAGYINEPSNNNEFFIQTSASTVLALIHSAIALAQPSRNAIRRARGNDLRQIRREDPACLALQFLLWLHPRQGHPELRPFVCFGILLLAAGAELGRPSGEDLLPLCAWVERTEAQSRALLGYDISSERWLLGLNSFVDCHRQREKWIKLPAEVFERSDKGRAANVQAALMNLSRRIDQ